MSLTTNAVNVAGSIGGVAQAVGNLANLFGPAAGTWAASLKTASYGGVKFGIESVRTAAGRQTAVHEYPFRDDVWVEDLGKKARRFDVVGFLVENDIITKAGPVVAQRDALLAACEKAGPQELVHPTLGTISSVSCLGIEAVERKDLGLVFEIRLTLIITGTQLYPSTVTTTGADSTAKATLTGIAALEDFVSTVVTTVQKDVAAVQSAVSTAVGWYQTAVTAVNDVKSVIGSVSTLFGNFGRLFGGANNGYAGANVQALPNVTADDLLAQATAARAIVVAAGTSLQTAAANPADSATFGAAAQALLTAVVGSASDPADAVRILGPMAQYQPVPVSTPGQIGEAMAILQAAISALLRRYALAQLATTLTTYQPYSQQDASTVLAQAAGYFDEEITIAGDTGDDNTYQALRALRQAVIADMNARGEDLASIATFQYQASLPSLVLANRIYRDPTREPGLVQQINPIHPAFCPLVFQALAT